MLYSKLHSENKFGAFFQNLTERRIKGQYPLKFNGHILAQEYSIQVYYKKVSFSRSTF